MNKMNSLWQHPVTGLGVILLTFVGCCSASTSPASTAWLSPGSEELFATPEQAADALVEADRRDDKAALLEILGMNASKIISSGDAVADKEDRDRFVKAYDQAHSIEDANPGQKILVVGEEEWPLPIPLVHVIDSQKSEEGWRFDTKAGEQEILNRRIGANEMFAIQICRVYVEAQREYAAQHHLPNGEAEYAQHFISSKGKHDGLYWPAYDNEEASPLGPLVAEARAEGYILGKGHQVRRHPYHGYFYKILTAQGNAAAGGAENYLHHQHMTGGFALIAFPDKYGDSGIMTFIVNQNGIVFQKNMGPETLKYASHIRSYDPDESWMVATLRP